MNNQTTIDFSCTCGQQFRARMDQGGKTRKCPSCAAVVTIPKVALAPVNGPHAVHSVESSPKGPAFTPAKFLQVPATFGHLLAMLVAVWAAFGVLMLIASFFSVILKYVGLLLFLGATGATVQQIWKLLRARQQVLDRKDVPLLWGFVRLIAWDPIQGVLVLKNKSVAFADDNLHDGHGGVRFLYPVLGEELALRVPLEVQTLRFADRNILTQEYLSVSVRGTMKWRIVDIRKFYLLVSRELRGTTDGGAAVTLAPRAADGGNNDTEALLKSAIEWMRILSEEQTRMVVSRTRSGLLMADRLSQELGDPQATALANTQPYPGPIGRRTEWGGATEGLAHAIHETIAARLDGYGIAVEDVSLQEINLPEEIVQECVAAAKAYYLPLRAEREAAFKFANRSAELRAEVEQIGRDAVGAREIVGAAPGFALTDFLSQFLSKRLATQTPGADAAMVGAIAGQIAAHSAPPGALPPPAAPNPHG